MSEKNILISLIPRIYHQTPTQSAPLLEILDRNRQRTEKMIEEITLLGNVDACPDEYYHT